MFPLFLQWYPANHSAARRGKALFPQQQSFYILINDNQTRAINWIVCWINLLNHTQSCPVMQISGTEINSFWLKLSIPRRVVDTAWGERKGRLRQEVASCQIGMTCKWACAMLPRCDSIINTALTQASRQEEFPRAATKSLQKIYFKLALFSWCSRIKKPKLRINLRVGIIFYVFFIAQCDWQLWKTISSRRRVHYWIAFSSLRHALWLRICFRHFFCVLYVLSTNLR